MRLAALAVGAFALALAFLAVTPNEASAGWRRGGGCCGYGYAYPAYVYPRWRGYGWGYGPYATAYRPYAYYPYWRGRPWRGGCCY